MSDNPMNAIFVPSPSPVEVSPIQVVGITPFGSYIEAAVGENFSPRNYGMLSPKIGQLSTLPPKQRRPEAIAEAVRIDPDITAWLVQLQVMEEYWTSCEECAAAEDGSGAVKWRMWSHGATTLRVVEKCCK